jgi:septation ring formation regulator EzrA
MRFKFMKKLKEGKIKTKDTDYIKPAIKLEKNMTFMFEAIKKSNSKLTCRQCSSCHGCR